MEKMSRKITPVNMAKTIQNALSGCMEMMIYQLTDRLVERFEKAAEKESNGEQIRRRKHAEVIPGGDGMSNIELELEATCLKEEDEKVDRVLSKWRWKSRSWSNQSTLRALHLEQLED
jgi:hypothetical protein